MAKTSGGIYSHELYSEFWQYWWCVGRSVGEPQTAYDSYTVSISGRGKTSTGFAEEREELDGDESMMISEINGPSDTISSVANLS